MFSKIKKIFFVLDKHEIITASILLIMMIVGVFAEMLSISLVIPILGIIQNPSFVNDNEYLSGIKSLFDLNNGNDFYIFILLSVIFIFITKNIYLFLLHIYQTKFVYNIQKNVSRKLFSGYIKMPYKNYLQRNSSTLIRNTIIEADQFASTIMSICYIILDSLIIIGLSSIVIIRDPFSAIFIIGTIGSIILMFQMVTRKKILKLGEDRQDSDEKRMLNLQQGLGGIKEIKIFGREKQFIKRYEKFNSRSANILSLVIIYRGIPKLLMETLAVTSILILVIIMIGSNGNMNEFLISLGLFAAIAFKIFPSLSRLITSLQVLKYSEPIVELINNELKNIVNNQLKHDNLINGSSDNNNILQDIKISGLCFNHNSKTEIINNLDLKIKAGSVIGILGPSGVGKSTLLDIFMGLLHPTKGTICYGENSIYDDLKKWQQNIGYVPQNIYLTDESLKNNIAYGINESEIDEDLLNSSINKSQLKNFIDSLPDKLNTVIGERGIRISGGQKQRIGIARALYHNPHILVFDEATSALDHKTEEQIVNSINELRNTKTIIIISHRQSTLDKCDLIYTFSNKKLIKTSQ